MLWHHPAFLSQLKVTLTKTFKGFQQEFSCIICKCQMCWSAKLEQYKVDFQNSIPSAVLARCNSVTSFLVNRLLHTGHFLLHTGCLKQQSCPAHICKIFQRMAWCQTLMQLKYPVTVQALYPCKLQPAFCHGSQNKHFPSKFLQAQKLFFFPLKDPWSFQFLYTGYGTFSFNLHIYGGQCY